MRNLQIGSLVVFQFEHMNLPRVAVVERVGNVLIHARDGNEPVIINVLHHWVRRYNEATRELCPVVIIHPENTNYDPEFDRQIDWFEA